LLMLFVALQTMPLQMEICIQLFSGKIVNIKI
jgi:hypothetical protein